MAQKTDGLFTMAVLNLCLGPQEKFPELQIRDNLG